MTWAGMTRGGRGRGEGMLAWLWRYGAGPQLVVLFLFQAYSTVRDTPAAGSWGERVAGHGVDLLILAFLVWRVSRGGRISRGLLIFECLLGYLHVVLSVARVWNVFAVAALAAWLVCLAILVSPAVRMRALARDSATAGLSAGTAYLWPPAWILPWGLVAGIVVTLLYLGNMDWAPLSGCAAAGTPVSGLPAHCFGLQEGYPLRFLIGNQGVPQILKASLLRDWAQWSLLCCSVLYLGWWLVRCVTPAGSEAGNPGTGRPGPPSPLSPLADQPAPDVT
jgi:hypothetical protein